MKVQSEQLSMKTEPLTGPSTTVHPFKSFIRTAVNLCNIFANRQRKDREEEEEEEEGRKKKE